MTVKETIEMYKSRDTSEKRFMGDESYLGNRICSSESMSGESGQLNPGNCYLDEWNR